MPPTPPVVTVKQAEGGRGGDVVVTAGGTKQPEAITKPIQQFVAAETIAPRTGYTDYLRLTKTSEIAAVAIPGRSDTGKPRPGIPCAPLPPPASWNRGELTQHPMRGLSGKAHREGRGTWAQAVV
ncbi:Uncharacterised protein [Mycobacteroides abscessus subsp. abscessus]|nr:Uncharacterised protein [Mycobacteroides abscessus subsp. abscessus]